MILDEKAQLNQVALNQVPADCACGDDNEQAHVDVCINPRDVGSNKPIIWTDDLLKIDKPKLLLHSCCGPCSTSVTERLLRDYDVTIYFYNPNITDKEEYDKRLEAQLKFIDGYNASPDKIDTIHFIEGPWDVEEFYRYVRNHEKDLEGGERCNLCMRMRLEKTAGVALVGGFQAFTTTLSVSPHKNHAEILKVGTALAIKYQLTFIPDDFKKKDGYKRSIELSKKYGLYRQNYCGCEFSKWET
ncbi:MAG: epoxyqueuosine reductase QueH [Clostridiales Family XIII bacterium]|nr:epoxyqueuosine reductase QueH [Clostridiales Family XIII bacterium]